MEIRIEITGKILFMGILLPARRTKEMDQQEEKKKKEEILLPARRTKEANKIEDIKTIDTINTSRSIISTPLIYELLLFVYVV